MPIPRRWRGALTGLTLAAATACGPDARADSSWLFGVSVGGGLQVEPKDALRFRVGLGADWLHHTGWTTALRATVEHDLATAASTMVGWTPPATLGAHAGAVGLHLGPSVRLDRALRVAAGGRALLTLGLWFRRVTVELDAAVYRPVDPRGSPGLTTIVGLALRVVPWDPLRT